MDPGAVLHPVGPLPASTYWIRRLVVVGLPLLVIVLLVALLGGGGSTPAAAPAPLPRTTASATPAAPTTATLAACEDTQLSVTAKALARSYVTGGPSPELRVSVVNTGTAPCMRDVGPAQQSVTVLRGSVRVWSSADCASVMPQVRTLAPGIPFDRTLTWTRSRSGPDCTVPAGSVDTGTYTVRGQLLPLPAVAGGTFTLG